MLRRFSKLLLSLALACSIGLHWALLQSVAWTSMLITNLSDTSLSAAITRTFDGKHPCPLCKKIAAAKKSTRAPEFSLQTTKLEFVSERQVIFLQRPHHFRFLPEAVFAFDDMTHEPPAPPPRAALA